VPFPGAPGAFAHHFRIPLLPLHDLKYFPTFLPHFFMVLLRRSRRFDLLLHLYGGTPQHTRFPIFFSKNKIFKIFLGPFPGPSGAFPTIFEFPYSRYITSIFSDDSTPFLTNFPTSSRLSLFIPVYPWHSGIGLNQLLSTRYLASVQSPCPTIPSTV